MENIVGKIKNYIERLDKGERLEAVRADFVREFNSVDASEIMAAEEELLKTGTPLTKVQRLCDVHAALFKGKISKEERMLISEPRLPVCVKLKKRMKSGRKMLKNFLQCLTI